MIDARVDEAIKQHRQKMDWLHGEEEAPTLTPTTGAAAGIGGKMGFNLPLSETPKAEEVIAPVLEVDVKQEGDIIPQEMTPPPLTEGESIPPAGQDSEDAVKAEVATPAEPPASTDSEAKKDKEDKTGPPPKEGTPV